MKTHRSIMVYSVFILIYLFLINTMVIAQPASVQLEEQPLEKILNPDGTLNMQDGINGSFNPAGYRMKYGPNSEPLFITSDQFDNHEIKFGNEAWDDQFTIDGVGGYVYAISVDVNGNIYVGGSFSSINELPANNIAKWDGNSWFSLGSGLNGTVLAIATSGGNVYVGGNFMIAGGDSVNYIARWNGSYWSPLGDGVNRRVSAIAIGGNDVYAGGRFTEAGGVVTDGIARWNGNSWSALGFGAPEFVTAIAVSGMDVYVGTDDAGLHLWNGTNWSEIGGFSDEDIYALAIGDSGLYVGWGNGVERWDGDSWSPFGSFANDRVRAIAIIDSIVFIGGEFTTIDGLPASYVSKWDGNTWQALGNGLNDAVRAIAISGNNVYIGGVFSTAGSGAANRIAVWNGSDLSDVGQSQTENNGIDFDVTTLAISGTDLYAGGEFRTAGNVPVSRIAKWDGSDWEELGSGVDDAEESLRVNAIAISGNDVYVGGDFYEAGGVSVCFIARWDGSNWYALGTGVDNIVNAITVHESYIYVGGEFTIAGGISANYIARWNGSNWSAIGTGVNGSVRAIAVSGNAIYAGGDFTVAGGQQVNYVARYYGGTWYALGSGVNSTVYAITADGSDIYLGGDFDVAGGITANYVALWDGSNWSTLGSGVDNSVRAIAMNGNEVYVGGLHTMAGGVVSNHIARWDGSQWLTFGSGVNDIVRAIAVNGNEIFVGGSFVMAGEKASIHVGKFTFLQPTSQPTNLTFSSITETSFTVSFTEAVGSPENYLVVRRTGASPNFTPVDGISYTLGESVGDGMVVYVGRELSFEETDLDIGTTYFFDVFAYNGTGPTSNYLNTSPLEGNQSTMPAEPSAQSTNMVFSDITLSSYTVSFTHASGSPDGYLVIRQASSSPIFVPSDGQTYAVDEVVGDGRVGYVGALNTFTENDLASGTTYFYDIYSYNGNGVLTNYMITAPLEGNVSTPAVEPSAQPINLIFSDLTTSSFTVSFNAAIGEPDGHIALRKNASAPTFVPVDGITYDIGQIVGDSEVVLFSDSTNFNQSGLSSGNEYFFSILAFNGSGGSINYLNTSPLEGSQAALVPEPSAQPSDLMFSGITDSSITVTFSAASDFPDGYIVLRKLGSELSGSPADGQIYVVGESIGDASIVYIGNVTSFTDTGLSPGEYFYKIYSFNGSSSAINYLNNSPLAGSQTTLNIDLSGPVIEALSIAPDPANLNTAININATITDESQITGVMLYYRRGDQAAFQDSVQMSLSTGIFSGTIPASLVTEAGVFYTIFARDFYNNHSSREGNCIITIPDGNISTASIAGNPYQSGFPRGQWRMISVPIKLDDNGVEQVLSEYGPHGDGTWRLFDYPQNDVSTSATFSLGKGYWLKHLLGDGSKQITLGSGKTASLEDGRIRLIPGWNQIGNPFTFPIDWAEDTDAAQNPDIKGPVKYDGSQYIGIGQTDGNPTTFTQLEPWDGYFVYNAASSGQTLTINPIRSTTIAKLARKSKDKPKLPHLLSTGWQINLRARSGNFKDGYNYIGTVEDASDLEDRYDLPELPVIGNYVSLWFDHGTDDGISHPYTIDYRAPTGEGYQWMMYIQTNVNEHQCDLEWTTKNLPENYHLAILDISNNKIVNMNQGEYAFNNRYEQHPVGFKIFVGSEEYVSQAVEEERSKLPDKYDLAQNYPNPFNPSTTIRFKLLRMSKVSLLIYNVLGEKVVTLLQGQVYDTGVHEIQWDGTDQNGFTVSSGLYIYMIRADQFSASKKMILLR